MVELTPPIERFLQASLIPVRLAVTTPTGWPMVVSVWYIFQEGALCCATPASARLVSYLQEEPRCAFEVAADLPPYCGVRGRAVADILPENGPAYLRLLLDRYLGNRTNPLAQTLLARAENEVGIRIRPVSIYRWNFTARMHDSVDPSRADFVKPCPELNSG